MRVSGSVKICVSGDDVWVDRAKGRGPDLQRLILSLRVIRSALPHTCTIMHAHTLVLTHTWLKERKAGWHPDGISGIFSSNKESLSHTRSGSFSFPICFSSLTRSPAPVFFSPPSLIPPCSPFSLYICSFSSEPFRPPSRASPPSSSIRLAAA